MQNLKKYAILLSFIILLSCNSENAPGCFKTAGKNITQQIAVENFNKINISEGIELVISQGNEISVAIKTGENLLENISAEVIDNQLFIKNNNSCNWIRNYNSTTVFVTVPNLDNIYSASQFSVRSQGILEFPQLSLQSGMFSHTASGEFQLNVKCNVLTIEDNKSSYFNISGETIDLNVNFYDGNARFDGENLVAKNVNCFQRSSNDIVVNPSDKVQGTIYSTGNIILKNLPPIIQVEELYQGRVILP
ncbi:DUF2807 domain-containing protein [Flavobacterium sp. NST-5]|uniref:DUF2807 domain-containing protein n=1 Tax=Flavobacterium ichthyis TaxID=2698827 RepID=A0ABW9Z4R8_9FLAO|nr:head GIN domain-containing protein [Flavobacterium ichthyis]NBL63831.1 DUF2807 domain-containing protein [Flavobacterium ichthyis]